MTIFFVIVLYDIAAVYSYQTEITRPLIDLGNLDLPTILRIRNSWLHHFLYSFCQAICRPKSRDKHISTKMWRLTPTACIHPYPRTLIELENRQTCADLNTHWIQGQVIPMVGTEPHRLYFRGVGRLSDEVYPVRGFTEPIRAPQADREQLPLLLDAGESKLANDDTARFLNELWLPIELETDFLRFKVTKT
ncbi:hypothetical protein BDV23DRAFT_176536 [Aspergillus alliaceus]|uniref:Uncharacterized protein n=1 Tax=Petromyces alliaceus TaxID=209559 RepID=A0A5N7BTA0_PETAA|nr:hypothetical protein BDV23DRAFT_176536 [Aspergillus alliaceus]